MSNGRLDGKRVLVTQAKDYMGPDARKHRSPTLELAATMWLITDGEIDPIELALGARREEFMAVNFFHKQD